MSTPRKHSLLRVVESQGIAPQLLSSMVRRGEQAWGMVNNTSDFTLLGAIAILYYSGIKTINTVASLSKFGLTTLAVVLLLRRFPELKQDVPAAVKKLWDLGMSVRGGKSLPARL